MKDGSYMKDGLYLFSSLIKISGVGVAVIWTITGQNDNWLIPIVVLLLVLSWYILDFYHFRRSIKERLSCVTKRFP
jgi:hypothetical protein